MNKGVSTETLLKRLEFGTLLGDRSTVERLLRGLLAFSHSDETTATAVKIHEDVPDGISETVLRDALGYMNSTGWISSEFRNGEIQYTIRSDDVIEPLVGAMRMLELSQRLSERRDPEQFELVCTLPENDPEFDGLHPVDFGLEQITSRLLDICGQAERRIVIFSPFIETDGIEWIIPGLKSAIQRGVSVDFISKDLEMDSPNSHALSTLKEADSNQTPGSLRIFDYYERPQDGQTYPVFTLHAKVLLVDRTTAYLGSANFTGNAFSRYLELGTILKGEQIAGLVDLADHVLNESAEQIHPATGEQNHGY